MPTDSKPSGLLGLVRPEHHNAARVLLALAALNAMAFVIGTAVRGPSALAIVAFVAGALITLGGFGYLISLGRHSDG